MLAWIRVSVFLQFPSHLQLLQLQLFCISTLCHHLCLVLILTNHLCPFISFGLCLSIGALIGLGVKSKLSAIAAVIP